MRARATTAGLSRVARPTAGRATSRSAAIRPSRAIRAGVVRIVDRARLARVLATALAVLAVVAALILVPESERQPSTDPSSVELPLADAGPPSVAGPGSSQAAGNPSEGPVVARDRSGGSAVRGAGSSSGVAGSGAGGSGAGGDLSTAPAGPQTYRRRVNLHVHEWSILWKIGVWYVLAVIALALVVAARARHRLARPGRRLLAYIAVVAIGAGAWAAAIGVPDSAGQPLRDGPVTTKTRELDGGDREIVTTVETRHRHLPIEIAVGWVLLAVGATGTLGRDLVRAGRQPARKRATERLPTRTRNVH